MLGKERISKFKATTSYHNHLTDLNLAIDGRFNGLENTKNPPHCKINICIIYPVCTYTVFNKRKWYISHNLIESKRIRLGLKMEN